MVEGHFGEKGPKLAFEQNLAPSVFEPRWKQWFNWSIVFSELLKLINIQYASLIKGKLDF